MNFFFVFLIALSLCFSLAAETNKEILRKIWKVGKEQSCTHEMREQFSPERLELLLQKIEGRNTRMDLEEVLNNFLFSLKKSHTEFFSSKNEGFHFFRSYVRLINEDGPELPDYYNPGVQLRKSSRGTYIIREVFNGYASELIDLRRGDEILSYGGKPFLGSWSTAQKKEIVLQRGKRKIRKIIEIKKMDISKALLNSQKRSTRLIQTNKGKIGYVRLWTGTHPESAPELQKTILEFKRNKVIGIILDLRGGYGGAWWNHLDPFFKNRETYFEAQMFSTDGSYNVLKTDPKINKDAYLGPMSVLINEGVRSGKEALAYQFKKTKRALLIGTKTPGYFTVGQFLYADKALDHVLYLCRNLLTLDGVVIEGVGVTPDKLVPFSTKNSYLDSQLFVAIQGLSL